MENRALGKGIVNFTTGEVKNVKVVTLERFRRVRYNSQQALFLKFGITRDKLKGEYLSDSGRKGERQPDTKGNSNEWWREAFSVLVALTEVAEN